MLGRKKIVGQKKFWVQQKSVPEKNVVFKEIWARKKFGSEKMLGPKNFVVVLVLLVTWTPNPLNSAKSP